jgi:hypothetical protein
VIENLTRKTRNLYLEWEALDSNIGVNVFHLGVVVRA